MARTIGRGLLAAWIVICALASPQAVAQPGPLEIGIFPLLSVRTLMERFQPMRDELEKSLQRPVTLITAPDFRNFVERTQAKQYRLVITAPHFARLAQKKAGYRPILQPINPMMGVFFVRKESKITSVSELKGSVIATPDPLALVTALGELEMKKHGVFPGKNAYFLSLPTHNAAILALQHGQVDAALASNYQFMQLKPEERAELRQLGVTEQLPAPFVILAGPTMPEAEALAIRQAILDFAEKTPAGKGFLERTGYQGFEAATETDMKHLDPFLPGLEKKLQEKP